MAEEGLINPQVAQQVKQTPRLQDMVYEAIRDAIATGRIKAGEWLRLESLAQELSVSPATVRHALSRLVAEGLAVAEPFRGVKVTLLPIADLEDLYETRAQMEGFAMGLAASQISDADLTRMKELLPDTAALAEAASADQVYQANREFHWLAIRSTGRATLMRILGQLWDMGIAHSLIIRGTKQQRFEMARQSLLDHTRILEALEARDAQRVRELTVAHICQAGLWAGMIGYGRDLTTSSLYRLAPNSGNRET